MQKKTVTICSSVTFYKEVLNIARELRSLGFRTVVPITAKRMERSRNFDEKFHKSWHRNPSDYKIKKKLMQGHFKEIERGDVVLAVNLRKNNIDGYIGGNVLMELALAMYLRKPIYVLHAIEENAPFTEEIMGMYPVFLNGDLSKIKK